MLAVPFLSDMVAVYMIISSWDPVRPEYNILLFDMAIRNSVLRVFVIAPLALGVILFFLLISPRIEDASRIIRAKLGMKVQTQKHRKISKFMTERILKEAMSVRFLVLCAILFSPLLIVGYFDLWNYAFLPFGITFAAILGIWSGFLSWSSFHQACSTFGIGEYSKKTYVKANSVDFLVFSLVSILSISPFIFLASSLPWQSFLYDNVVVPVLMLEQWPETSIFGSNMALVGLQGIFLISFTFLILGGLFFLLFPYIYREGRHGVSVAGITFVLTFLTEWIVSAVFQEMDKTLFQPLAFAAPLLVSLVSWIAQDRYRKAVAKLIK